MTVRNGMYGQVITWQGISPAPTPAEKDPGGGGLGGLWRTRSDRRSQDTLARHEITVHKMDFRRRRLQSGDHLAWTATAFAR